MRELLFEITECTDGKTVGALLRYELCVSSRLLPVLKREGGIVVNGENVTVRHVVHTGDVLSVRLSETAPSENVVPSDIPLDVIFEDEDILAVRKPKDMPVHPSLHNYTNTLGNAVMNYYKDRPFVFRPLTRLDRDTTGIVLIAKNRLCASVLSENIKEGKVKKSYLALLSKTPDLKKGTINAPIARSGESIIKRCVREDGKYAVSEYEVISVRQDGSCVARVNLVTGRTHQIRVHMAHIGCPLKYDYLYGTEVPGKTLFLHCEKLEFHHPLTRENIVLSCPVFSDSELSEHFSF
jgi:23S rRNA pseudouridine1911/1915/1917 synthase